MKIPEIYYTDKMEPVVTMVDVPDDKGGISQDRQPQADSGLFLSKKVSIVIVCWDQLHYTKQCIDSIIACTVGVRYELILVNNASTDGTEEYFNELARTRPNIHVVHNKENLGFGPGNNVGFRLASGDYVCCLNNDTVVKPGWLRYLMRPLLTDPHVGIVGPVGASLKVDGGKFVHVGGTSEDGKEDVHYIEGWCLLISKALLDRVGGFDESYGKAFSEDAELSFRVKAAGYRLLVRNNGSVIHFANKTIKKVDFDYNKLAVRNNRLLYKRWGPDVLKLNCSRILIVRAGARGDVLMCVPILKALRKKFPGSHIGFATDCPEMLNGLPYMDEVILMTKFDTSEWSKVYRLSYEAKPGGNAVEVMARQAGVECEDKTPELVIPKALNLAVGFMKSGSWIVIHTGRSWPNREWIVSRWKELLRELRRRGFMVAEVGDDMTELTGIGVDCRNMTVHETAAIIKEAKLFIGIDSLCAHLSKAVGTPAVVIYGCVDPGTRENGGIEYPVWVKDLDCRGCRNKTDAEYVSCRKQRIDCIEGITVEMVLNSVKRALGGRNLDGGNK